MFDLWFFELVRRILDFCTVPRLQFKFKHEVRRTGTGKAMTWQPYEQAGQILQDHVVDTYPVYFGLKLHASKSNKVFFENYDDGGCF
jgi:hypothetical protein